MEMESQTSGDSLQNLCLNSKKRTFELFVENNPLSEKVLDEPSFKVRLMTKINDEYKLVKDLPPPEKSQKPPEKTQEKSLKQPQKDESENKLQLQTYLPPTSASSSSPQKQIVMHRSLSLRTVSAYAHLKPEWHAPWKLMRVISGHLGWVRAITVDVSNEWFCTGAADRCIKIWDLASGTLKLTLTGHINCVRGLAVSNRHPYLFSCAEDKTVRCWDLEYNKVIRHYHGHLSGVYCLSLHPTLDVLVTGGRDSTARVWDIRTKACIHVLTGHQNTVCSVVTQSTDPQVVTGSHDSTIRFWDLAKGATITTLTHHKKSVRALALHPKEYAMVSGAPDNIKKWKFPEGKFLQNFSGHNTPIETLAVNEDGVVVSGGFNGSMYFWDWKTGYNFQKLETTVQPGSLSSEAGIFASSFDRTGSRFITCEADKSIKVWKEDESATPETHPIVWNI